MSRKALILDANILIRAVLGQRVRTLITESANHVDFFSPNVCFDDARKYLPALLSKRGIAPDAAMDVLNAIAAIVRPVEAAWLEAFETEARMRMKLRDEQDWPILAAALALECGIWTEDADFFGVGIATWITANVHYFFAR